MARDVHESGLIEAASDGLAPFPIRPDHMRYRPEIDGLRTIAVIPVILSHAGIALFSGGFVGVDIFFVISGYLITTILFNEIDAGTFDIVNFYERRARRILPALFLVMLLSLPFAWFWLLPQDLASFAKSVMAVSVYGSNFLFWKESGYFATAAQLKPLLHTWSLAVEEQFYIFFPILLVLLSKFGKRWDILIILAGAVASLVLSQWGVVHNPDATYFLLPTRAWELAIGSLVAFYWGANGGNSLPAWANHILSLIGIALILFAILAFSETTPFPGFYALLPTVGAALLIVCAMPNTLVGKLLGTRIFVGVGLISYSAYLWHQPLFAFARHGFGISSNKPIFIALSILTMFLSYLSWRFVELPFRDRSKVSKKQIFSFSIAGSAFFLGVGALAYGTDGFVNRMNADQKKFADFFEDSSPRRAYEAREGVERAYRFDCNFKDIAKERAGAPTNVPLAKISTDCFTRDAQFRKSVFIWGDSHAQHLIYGIRKNLPKDWQVMQVASSGCKARLGAIEDRSDYCEYSNWFALKSIAAAHPDVVVIGQQNKHDIGAMKKLTAGLRRIGIEIVIFTGPSPHWTSALPAIVVYRLWGNPAPRSNVGLDRDVLKDDAKLLQNAASEPDVKYLSIIEYFCNEDGCLTYLGKDRMRGIASYDYGHLSLIASDAFARDRIVPMILKEQPAK